MNNINTKNIIIGVCALLIIVGSVFYALQNRDKNKSTPTPVVKNTQNKTPEKVVNLNAFTTTNIPLETEFYDEHFTQGFKELYVKYEKGAALFNNANQKDKDEQIKYYKEALLGFATLSQAKDKAVTNKEKAYALNLINAIYLALGWDDGVMKDTVYTVAPFSAYYSDNMRAYEKVYPELKKEKDFLRNIKQTALVGAASQKTLSDINALAYKYYPIGYSYLRWRMNEMSADYRYAYDPKNMKEGENSFDQFTHYADKKYGKDGMQKYQETLTKLEKDGKLTEGVGVYLTYEIYVMRTVTLWDPLTFFSKNKADAMKYHEMSLKDWRKVSFLVSSLKNRPAIYASISFFYNAFLVNYGMLRMDEYIIPGGFLPDGIRQEYVNEAKQLAHTIIKANNKARDILVQKNKNISDVPEGYNRPNERYTGRQPYYQLRALAGDDVELKKYLVSMGWNF